VPRSTAAHEARHSPPASPWDRSRLRTRSRRRTAPASAQGSTARHRAPRTANPRKKRSAPTRGGTLRPRHDPHQLLTPRLINGS
jgi:hypothetical protein